MNLRLISSWKLFYESCSNLFVSAFKIAESLVFVNVTYFIHFVCIVSQPNRLSPKTEIIPMNWKKLFIFEIWHCVMSIRLQDVILSPLGLTLSLCSVVHLWQILTWDIPVVVYLFFCERSGCNILGHMWAKWRLENLCFWLWNMTFLKF